MPLLHWPLQVFTNHQLIVGLAQENRLPSVYPASNNWSSRLVASCHTDRNTNERSAAVLAYYVDRNLKVRAKPARYCPVERPMKFEFVINLKAAKEIGLNDSSGLPLYRVV